MSHTWDEIHQQPWAWRETARRVAAFADPAAKILRDQEVLAPGSVPDGFLVFSGMGSSHFIGKMIEDGARRSLGAYVLAVSSADLLLSPNFPPNRRGVLMSFSRSGESPEVVEAARRVAADYSRIAHVVVTCNAQGALGRECPGLNVVLHEKTCDRGLAMTSSVTSMTLAGRFLTAPFRPAEFIERVESLSAELEKALPDLEARANAVAELDPERIVVLGGGEAVEGALKIMELTDGQVATIAQGFLDVRHGPMSFVNERTVVIACGSRDETLRRYEKDLVGSLRPRCRELLELDHSDHLLDVVFAQLVGHALSLRRGLDPDAPSKRGIITRVVQGVTMHPRPPQSSPNPVAEELARRGGETLPLKDFAPVSMLKTRETLVRRPQAPVIDIHTHIDADDPRELIGIMDECGVERMINLTASTDNVRSILDRFASKRFGVMVTPDWTHEIGAEARRLRELVRAGACGIKIYKSRLGRLIQADDPELDPIWDAAEGKPVAIHIGDPRAFFHSRDRFNERFEELAAHPDWSFAGQRWEALLDQRDRLFDRRRDVRWLSVHVGGASEDLENASRMLDRFPHVTVDIAARVAELGRQPYRAREFLIQYADRVCFGTDLPPHVETYRAHYRFLETDDEYFDYPSHGSRQGRWKIYGLKLPAEVLEKIYSANARRLLSRP